MTIGAIIFDMDGLLIDSEPIWEAAGTAVLNEFRHHLTPEQYASSTGLRTKEWLQQWFLHFGIDQQHVAKAEQKIVDLVMHAVDKQAIALPGVHYMMNYAKAKGLKIGIATSSPQVLADLVIHKLKLAPFVHAISTAEHLEFGKPHPQVYLNCASLLGIAPGACVCFEDSFNGLIAAKAAKMKCVVVPAQTQLHQARWAAADLKISSLQNFNDLLFHCLA